MYFADNSIFIAVAMMIYVFTVSRAKTLEGQDIIPEVQYDGFIAYAVSIDSQFSLLANCRSSHNRRHPKPFQCIIIKPRSSAAEALIKNSIEDVGAVQRTSNY